MKSLSSFTRHCVEAFALALFSVVLVSQTLNILFRYTKVHAPFMWVEEFTRFSLIWIVFLLWHLADRDDRHFKVDFAVASLGEQWQRRLAILQSLLILGFAAITIWSSVLYIPSAMGYRVNSFPWLPMGIVYLIIPIGLFLVGLERIRILFHLVSGR